MIHPSYVDLMKVVNKGIEEGEEPVISSRYSIVMATSKRARQLIANDEPLVPVKPKEKPLSIAVRELNDGVVRILNDDEKAALEQEKLDEEAAKAKEAVLAEEETDSEEENKETDD